MDPKDLQKRTKNFAIRIVKLVQHLQKDPIGKIIANQQLLRCGTAVAANYRAVCRSQSVKHFISKLAIVIEEADETQFWLEILVEAGILKLTLVQDLLQEAGELVAIMTASKNSAIKNQKKKNFT
ncbi:MAG: four helix bundle protein [Patescibacteria group bacterium]|nr:four helix bundle protein [Patescibacteria group bacterium]